MLYSHSFKWPSMPTIKPKIWDYIEELGYDGALCHCKGVKVPLFPVGTQMRSTFGYILRENAKKRSLKKE